MITVHTEENANSLGMKIAIHFVACDGLILLETRYRNVANAVASMLSNDENFNLKELTQ